MLHPALHLFEENALMSGVLVDEHETASVFHEDVEAAEHTEQAKVFVFGRLGLRAGWGRWDRWDGWD
jgi:hypothetical protein